MKVIVLYQDQTEQALAENLVRVLGVIGVMLVHGTVSAAGVLLQDWQSKPRVKMECVAGPAASMPTLSPLAKWEMDLLGYRQPSNTKPVAPQPDTTKTGVTVRELDIWEDDHE